jgi:hypothetical protein
MKCPVAESSDLVTAPVASEDRRTSEADGRRRARQGRESELDHSTRSTHISRPDMKRATHKLTDESGSFVRSRSYAACASSLSHVRVGRMMDVSSGWCELPSLRSGG